MKKIRIILSKKQFEEIQEIQKDMGIKTTQTYEKYLEEEKKNPTECLFG